MRSILTTLFGHILLIIAFGFSSPASYCQSVGGLDSRVNFSELSLSVGKAIGEIEGQSSYTFVYDTGKLDTGRRVRLSKTTLSVGEALGEIFRGSGYAYTVRNNFIGINPAARTAATATPQPTKDVYRPNRVGDRKDGDPRMVLDGYDTERVVSYLPGEIVERHYPESYSAYTGLSGFASLQGALPRVAVKSNLLYGAAATAPNLAFEVGTGLKTSVGLSGGYTWWGRTSAASDTHNQFAHFLLRPEFRFWTCERFGGHYFGVHGLYSRYSVYGREVPLLFKWESSYDGWAAGGGFSYGYHWAFARRWGLEFSLGVGYAYLKYDQGSCSKCEPRGIERDRHYFGPTGGGVSLVFVIL